jgi:hypothetical protein
MFELIEQASQGEYSEPVGRCADFGVVILQAYLYDPQQALYHPVLLYQIGDWAQQNMSASAEHLYQWLNEVTGQYDLSVCQP